MKKLNLLLIVVLFLFTMSCNQNKTDKEKLKEEVKEELRQEMEKERESKETDKKTTEKTSETEAQTRRTSPKKVSFDADMLKNLTLYGKKSVIRFNQDNAVKYSLTDGSQEGTISYDGNNLKDAVTVFPEKELIVKIHQNHAIGGIIGIKKTDCKRFNQSGFSYSFKITWENESDLNDTGCGFHNQEEYQIVAKLEGAGFGTGGDFFSFSDNSGKGYDFFVHKQGVGLKDYFPELNPMDNKNPYKNKKYRIFYKFVEVDDHRSFRVEPIVTYIEEIHSIN